MASFRNVPHGKVEQFNSRLAEAGFDETLIDFVNSRPELTREWEQSLRAQLNPPAPTFDWLFQTPEQVFDASMARAADRNWPFSLEQTEALFATMPADFNSRLDSVLTLDIWLGDLPATFKELWAWNIEVQEAHGNSEWSSVETIIHDARLLHPERYSTRPSVRWVVIDLIANRGQAPKHVHANNAAGLEVFTTAALHPAWPKAIDHDTIPGVTISGLECKFKGISIPHVLHPYWDRIDHKVGLQLNWVTDSDPAYSVPTVRKL